MVETAVVNPSANIPVALSPAAAPALEATVAAPPVVTESPEYVYLLRVVDDAVVNPKANIPTVPSDLPGCGHNPCFTQYATSGSVQIPGAVLVARLPLGVIADFVMMRAGNDVIL